MQHHLLPDAWFTEGHRSHRLSSFLNQSVHIIISIIIIIIIITILLLLVQNVLLRVTLSQEHSE